MPTSVPVYAYFNVQQVATVMDAVAAITKSADYMDAFRLLAMIGFLVFVAGVAMGKQKDPFDFFKWFLTVAVINTVLLVPKIDVVIVDRTSTTPPTVRADIPVGFAFFASVTSSVGDWLTRTFETVFAMPNDVQFQRTGLMFGNTVLNDSLRVSPETPTLRKDINDFINSCTYYDILEGRISQETLTTSDDIWAVLKNTSLARLTPSSADPSGSLACDQAYNSIDARLADETKSLLQTRGRFLNPSSPDNVTAGTSFSNQLTSSYAYLTGISKSATDIMRQAMFAGSMRESQMVSAQRLDAPSSAIVANAVAQTEIQTNTNFLSMGRVAERAAPAIRNVVEILTYAVFPLIILLMVVAGEGSGTYLKGYVMALVWVQLIPPLYAILNFVMNSVAQAKLTGIVAGTSATGVTLQNIGDLSQHGISDMAIAGYLTLSIPAIAWALVKGGEVGGSALFSGIGGVIGSTSGSATNAISNGNITQGAVALDNTNLNNNSSNHYDAAPTANSGYTRVTDGLGTTTYGPNGQVRHQALQSSTPFSANFGTKVANSVSAQAAHRAEVSKRETEAAGDAQTSALVQRMAIASAYTQTKGNQGGSDISRGSRSTRALAEMDQIAQQVNKMLGLNADSSVGRSLVGSLSLGGEMSAGGKGGRGKGGVLSSVMSALSGAAGVSLKNDTVTTANVQQTIDSATSYARNQMHQKGLSSDVALSDDFRSTQAYQWAKQNRSEVVNGEDAALTAAQTHTKNAERANSESLTLSQQAQVLRDKWETMGMDYTNYVVGRLASNGQLEAFNMLSQTAPDRAAEMAAKYALELAPGLAPTITPVSGDLSQVQAQSPELAGATLAKPGFDTSIPQDATHSDFARNKDAVTRRGPVREPTDDTITPVVQQQRTETEERLRSEEKPLVKDNANERQEVLTQLGSDMQRPGFGPKPGEEVKPRTTVDMQRKRLAELQDQEDRPTAPTPTPTPTSSPKK